MNVNVQHQHQPPSACAVPDPESAELAAAGLRVTIVRVAVLRLMRMNAAPLQAIDAFQRLADAGYRFGIAAVYKTLREFELVGIVVRELANESNGNRRGTYSLRANGLAPVRTVRLLCRTCKRESLIDDVVVSAQLSAALVRVGIEVPGHPLLLHIAHCSCL